MSTRIDRPLIVDLDGTLTPADTLHESLATLIARAPLCALLLPLWLVRGRANFKQEVSTRSGVAAETLPYRESLLAYLRTEKAKGRRIVLATAAHRDIAHAVAKYLGIFDLVIASDETRNLRGAAKLDAIFREVGEDFSYAGNSDADLPIWAASGGAIVVGASQGLTDSVRSLAPIEREFPAVGGGPADWLRALRVHQWLKNLLLFVPWFTAFSFEDTGKGVTTAWAFFSFSLAASAMYIFNDLHDITSDRLHPRKRDRPLASARLPIPQAVALAGCVLISAFVIAAGVGAHFIAVLTTYVFLAGAYTVWIRERAIADLMLLSTLYTLRIFAGSVAAGISVSSWLLAFSMFTFLSLASVKRCSELIGTRALGVEIVPGRGYRTGDLDVLLPLGIASSMCGVVVLGLFISAPETQARYGSPHLLWGVAIALVYWLARMWLKTSRGEMNDDPLVFAMRDAASVAAILLMLCAALGARFLHEIAI